MKTIIVLMCIALTATGAGRMTAAEAWETASVAAIDKGAKWLASVQGADGGWGQDGGATSYVRTGERLEFNGNDVANTAVATLALLQSGKQYQPNVERALDFILQHVEASRMDGMSITDIQGTQIQRKLGRYIDTFLTSMLLAQVDGTLSKPAQNARVRQALQKCVTKIERNQQTDGSWNLGGGWAPVLGTALASRSLYAAQQKGVAVADAVMVRADGYTVNAIKSAGVGGGARPEAAGVPLYQSAQALEQLSRTESDRQKNAKDIAAIKSRLTDPRFVEGFGSMGGEEFFSYLNIRDSLKRTGGDDWRQWQSKIAQKIVSMQNNDGWWAGQHCITGRVTVTSAAILNLTMQDTTN